MKKLRGWIKVMKRFSRYTIRGRVLSSSLACVMLGMMLTACGIGASSDNPAESGTMDQSARIKAVDIPSLKAQNPDIFGWVFIPDTMIDTPILQNGQGEDEYYETHDCTGAENESGAVYIKSANLSDMCDFNEILYFPYSKGDIISSEVVDFLDESYFESHPMMYIYIDGNALTYEVYAAYESSNIDVLRNYDFTTIEGCEEYIRDMETDLLSGGLIRTGWEEGVDPYNYLVTLSTVNPKDSSKRVNVVGCLIGDASGTIYRSFD